MLKPNASPVPYPYLWAADALIVGSVAAWMDPYEDPGRNEEI
jgi:hypothetical protein